MDVNTYMKHFFNKSYIKKKNQFRYKIKGDQFCQNNHDTRNPIKGDQL